MARTISVEILGDEQSLLRAYKSAANGAQKFQRTVKQQVEQTIVSQVQEKRSLQNLATEYNLVARNAKKGSEVQVAAARLAAEAQQKLGRSYALTAHEAAHMSRAGGFGKTAEHDLTGTARGAVAASGAFRGMGRSIAFASGYFLGGAGLVYGLKTSVAAAETFEKAQRSLAVTIQKTGGNVKQILPGIEQWAKAQASVGITAAEAEQGLARAAAITGSATKGQRAYTEALLISKATGKSFNSVLIAAAKANNGSTTALARYIGKIAKGTSAQKLYNDVTARYKGQAEANTTATEKLSASLANVELIVGTALLPTINHYATVLSNWLGKSRNQERVQRDVNATVRTAAGILRGAASATRTVTGAVGGLKNALELLLALKLASKLAGWATAIGGIGAASTTAAGEVGVLRGALMALGGPEVLAAVGAAFAVVKGFQSAAGHLRSFKVKGGLLTEDTKTGGFTFRPSNANRGPTRPHHVTKAQAQQLLNDSGQTSSTGAVNADVSAKVAAARARAAAAAAGSSPSGTPPKPAPRRTSLQGQLNLAELAIAQASNTAGNKDDLAALRRKEAILKAMIAKGGTLAQQTQREQDLRSTKDNVASLLTSAASANKTKATATKKAWAEYLKSLKNRVAAAGLTAGSADDVAALRAEIAAIRAREAKKGKTPELEQSRIAAQKKLQVALNNKTVAAWGEYLKSLKNRVSAAGLTKGVGDDIAALKAEIRAIKDREKKVGKTPELEQVRIHAQKQLQAANKKKPVLTFTEPFKLLLAEAKAGATKTGTDDLKAEKALRNWTMKMIRSGKLRGQALIDAWNEVARLNDQIASASAQTTQHVVASSSRMLTAGLNLSAAQRQALEGRYADALAHGGRMTQPGEYGANGVYINTVHVNGVTDVKGLSDKITKHAKRNTGQSRGTRPGSYLGHH